MSEFSRRQAPRIRLPVRHGGGALLPAGRRAASGRRAGDRPHERPYFLFVGRLEKIKGLDDVIPLFRDYAGADLLIAGDGEYADDAASARPPASTASGSWDACRIGDRRRYYAHAIALIVPSVCFETFGIILIEAFRQGTPVIARRIGPFPEIVERRGGGVLFETAAELLDAMQRIQADPRSSRRLGASGPPGASRGTGPKRR